MPKHIPIGEASEDDCAVCGGWPTALREAMRSAVYVLPLKKPVCGGCVMAFGANIAAKAQRKRPS